MRQENTDLRPDGADSRYDDVMGRLKSRIARLLGWVIYAEFALVIALLGWKVWSISAPQGAGAPTEMLPEPESVRSSRYQALATWAAVLVSLAALAGVIFNALTIRYQAEQTGLQAAASREQVDQQDKQQAQLVSIWAASEFTPEQALVMVSNRSQEPLSHFQLYIAFKTSRSGGYLAISTWSSFQPCTQVTFDLRAIAESYAETARLMLSSRAGDFDYGLMFKDATGQTLHRHASGMLHTSPWLEYLSEPRTGNPSPPPVFRSYTLLATDQFTTPEEGGRFIAGGPKNANSCS